MPSIFSTPITAWLEAAYWFKKVCENFPDQPLLATQEKSMPGTITLDDYALARLSEDVGETSQDRVKSLLEGIYINHFNNVAIGVSDDAVNYELMAQKIWTRYHNSIGEGSAQRIGLPPLEVIKKQKLDDLLGTNSTLHPLLQAQLRTALGIPAPASSNSSETNAPSRAP